MVNRTKVNRTKVNRTKVNRTKVNRGKFQRCVLQSLGVMLLGTFFGCGLELGGDASSSNSAVSDYPVAYIQRKVPLESPDDLTELIELDWREPYAFRPGAELFLKSSASPGADTRLISSGVFEGAYDVRDLAVSNDGLFLLFSMRAPEIPDADDDEQPTWNIWMYDVARQSLKRVIESDIVAEAGQDIQPQFLPDGRIVFSSSRQQGNKAKLIDEGKPQFSALDERGREPSAALHVMSSTGGDIEQISFNPSHDLDPQVMADGRILFSRWDNMGGRNRVNLYSIYPDGTGLSLTFGWHTHELDGENIQYTGTQVLESGSVLVRAQGFDTERLSTRWRELDITNYLELDRTAENLALESPDAISDPVGSSSDIGATAALSGRLHRLTPLWDGSKRYLMSWAPCRVFDPKTNATAESESDALTVASQRRTLPCTTALLETPDIEEAPPLYALWLYDPVKETQLPIVIPPSGAMVSEAVVLGARRREAVAFGALAAGKADTALADQGLGLVDILSVYDQDGVDTANPNIATLADPLQRLASERPARFLRLSKAVLQPNDDVATVPGTAFGPNRSLRMQEIIGYTPIEPDGSVKVAVPANVAFSLAVVDAMGRRISEPHLPWLQVRPGETLTCHGCHTAASQVPHGRLAAQLSAVNRGAEAQVPFPNTVTTRIAQIGETMAQTSARLDTLALPTLDLIYEDKWTDPAIRAPDSATSVSLSALSTTSPASQSDCTTRWQVLCRLVIHYEQHIHPLWSVDRRVLDSGGALLSDNTCTACHSPVNAMSEPRVPEAQLDLSDGTSPEQANHYNAYRELLFNDNEQVVIDGVLQDRLVAVLDASGNPVFERDADGALILDATGAPVPREVTVRVSPVLSAAGSLASAGFFDLFDRSKPLSASFDHRGILTDAELKLLAEWVDIGAQYYNDPFTVPQN